MVRVICVLFGIFGLNSGLHGAEKPCELKMLASVEVDINENGTVVVPVTINGRDVWMGLSLNQGLPLLYPAAVEELKLPTKGTNIGATTGGQKVRKLATVKQLLVGHAHYADWEMLVLPGSNEELTTYKGKPYVGWLSSRFIQVVDVELNLAERKVNLFSQTACKGEAL